MAATITAQLLLPAEVNEPFVYVFGSGTTGLDNLCVPSRELTDGVNFSNYLTYGLTAAAQDGHASLAAANALTEYAPDLPLGGVVGYGSSTDLEALLRDWQVAAPYIVFVMSELSLGTVDPAEILLPYYAENLVEEVT